jgi:hypothetical protein
MTNTPLFNFSGRSAFKNPLRNCECCGGTYSTGKEYGDYWCEVSHPDAETKGLCEWCNPSHANYNHKPSHVRESCRIV